MSTILILSNTVLEVLGDVEGQENRIGVRIREIKFSIYREAIKTNT